MKNGVNRFEQEELRRRLRRARRRGLRRSDPRESLDDRPLARGLQRSGQDRLPPGRRVLRRHRRRGRPHPRTRPRRRPPDHPAVRRAAPSSTSRAGGDPFERREARPLDFGHWAAHRLESMSDFGPLPRGGGRDRRLPRLRPTRTSIESPRSRIGVRPESSTPRPASASPSVDSAPPPITACSTGLEEFREHLGGRLTVTLLDEHRARRGCPRRGPRHACVARSPTSSRTPRRESPRRRTRNDCPCHPTFLPMLLAWITIWVAAAGVALLRPGVGEQARGFWAMTLFWVAIDAGIAAWSLFAPGRGPRGLPANCSSSTRASTSSTSIVGVVLLLRATPLVRGFGSGDPRCRAGSSSSSTSRGGSPPHRSTGG